MDGVIDFALRAFLFLGFVLIGALTHRLLLIPAYMITALLRRGLPMQEAEERKLAASLAGGLLAALMFTFQTIG